MSITKIVGDVYIEKFKHFNDKFVHSRRLKFQLSCKMTLAACWLIMFALKESTISLYDFHIE